MRSWLYRHPTWAVVVSLVALLACLRITHYVATEVDGWWKLAALGWVWWSILLMDAIERFWRLS